MSADEALRAMNPSTRAVAEAQANEAGLSLGQWLDELVHDRAIGAGRRSSHFSSFGWTGRRSQPISGSHAVPFAPAARHGLYDLDFGAALWGRDQDIPRIQANDVTYSEAMHLDISPVLTVIANFPPRIDHAAILLSAAFAEAQVTNFTLPPARRALHIKGTQRWYRTIVDTCVHRSEEVRAALVHHWVPRGRAERLWDDAFLTLCDLSPARRELLLLCNQDRTRASAELAKHLAVATEQFVLSANLLAELDVEPATAEDKSFADARDSLLARAGGGVSLTQGAEMLGVTRQALHKRIKSGTALGMMHGDEIVLPRIQWIVKGDKPAFVPGLSKIVKLFDRAGGWSALQFLLDVDPNLGEAPVDALHKGRADEVALAARAYLGLDEG